MQVQQSKISQLGIQDNPIFLAPLAGVSDHPFRRMCIQQGADLTYVEMISATALLYNSERTLDMLSRHPEESILGVQVTAKNPDEMGRAVAKLSQYSFETIDINMGCPVKKVVNAGCGSAALKDPDLVYRLTKAATSNTDKPLSVKIRLGWDHQSINYLAVGEAAEKAGAAWITLHGRTRSDTYAEPVHLESIAALKKTVGIPVLGNGNLFYSEDYDRMRSLCGVDGVMVSRGALGNPWIFGFLKGERTKVTLDEWHQGVLTHIRWQQETYGHLSSLMGIVCLRKHLIWYSKGWTEAKRFKEAVSFAVTWDEMRQHVDEFANALAQKGHHFRRLHGEEAQDGRFVWDPKYDMDRQLDAGVGADQL